MCKKMRKYACVLLCVFLSGCSKANVTLDDGIVNIPESINEGNSSTETMGRLEHGLVDYLIDDTTGEAYITYNGGELGIEYSVCASGMAEQGVGFMIFIDGEPQLYRTDKEEYKYMHNFYFEDNDENTISFYLIPTTGQKGETLELCIASMYYPDYKPDLISSKGVGIYHHMLESIYLLKYNETPSMQFDKSAYVNETATLRIESISTINDTTVETKTMFLNDFSGYICYAGNEKLICLGEEATLLNSQNFDVLNEIESEELEISFYDFQDCEVYANENGYIVIGTVYNAQNSSTRLVMVEFNQELSNVKVINVEEWVGAEREIMVYKLIDDGRKILYSTMNGFFLYDSVCGETITLDTRGVFVLDFAFIESSNQILFIGNDLNSERVLGRLELGEKASAAEIYEGNPWGKIWAYGEGALIEEADVYGEKKVGRVFCYSIQDGIRQYPLTSIDESGSIILSHNGEYYATKTFVQNEGYILRVYSSENGQLVREYLMTYEEYGEKFRLSNVLIYEDINRIILMVNGVKNQEEGTWLIAIDL